eukprot:11159040-Lingulodinium_polyedra.AAC.1
MSEGDVEQNPGQRRARSRACARGGRVLCVVHDEPTVPSGLAGSDGGVQVDNAGSWRPARFVGQIT